MGGLSTMATSTPSLTHTWSIQPWKSSVFVENNGR
jgi:hypothetical protein